MKNWLVVFALGLVGIKPLTMKGWRAAGAPSGTSLPSKTTSLIIGFGVAFAGSAAVALSQNSTVQSQGSTIAQQNAALAAQNATISQQNATISNLDFHLAVLKQNPVPYTYLINTSTLPNTTQVYSAYNVTGCVYGWCGANAQSQGGATGTNSTQVVLDTLTYKSARDMIFNGLTPIPLTKPLVLSGNQSISGFGSSSCLEWTSNTDGIDVSSSTNQISNLCLEVTYPFTSAVIRQTSSSVTIQQNQYSNLYITAVGFTSFTGTAIQLGQSSGGTSMYFDQFSTIYIEKSGTDGFLNGIMMNSSSVADVNANQFSTIHILNTLNAIVMNNVVGHSYMTGNIFNTIDVESNSVADSKCITMDGQRNVVTGLSCYDSVNSPSPIIFNADGAASDGPNIISDSMFSTNNVSAANGAFYQLNHITLLSDCCIYQPVTHAFFPSGGTVGIGDFNSGGSGTPTNDTKYNVDGTGLLFACTGGTIKDITVYVSWNVGSYTAQTYTACSQLPWTILPYGYQINFSYGSTPTVDVWSSGSAD